MDIEILNLSNIESAQQGWRLSRDVSMLPSAATVAPVDAPVNELPSALLHFHDFMILEREIFTTPRNHVIWARTSRVDDPLQFRVPAEFHCPEHNHLRTLMQVQASAGVAQDLWRMNLPITSLTSWTARMSLRDVIKIENYFRFLSHIPALENRFTQVANRLLGIADQLTDDHVLTAQAVKAFKPVRFLSEQAETFDQSVSVIKTENFTILKVIVPLALRAQLVRHRALQFTDNFYQLLLNPAVATLGSLVMMELSATNADWRAILSKRSCWIAQQDLWSPILQLFDPSVLPCADGICPYSKDAEIRFTDADPGVPCPRYANLNGIDKTPFLPEMMAEAKKRSAFWIKEVEK